MENSFTLHKLLREMIILKTIDIEINMETILNGIKEITEPTKLYVNSNGIKYELNIFEITKVKFSFEFNGIIGINLFRKPIYYWHGFTRYEFISQQQFDAFINKFNIPLIKCYKENDNFKADLLTFRYHIQVLNHTDRVIEGFNFKIFNKIDYDSFFANNNLSFINRRFDSPDKFEKNFQYYFDFNKKLNINGPFNIIDDKDNNREYFVISLTHFSNKNSKFYYGSSGQGKSVTLIGALKYRNNFNTLGSLYINCKALKCLIFRGDILEAKQILIDEIFYLTPFNYEQYLNLIDIIKYFNFVDEYSYLELIKKIIEVLEKIDGQYLFAFDQYNDSNDPKHIAKDLIKKYNQNKNFLFLVFSSMNETDIRIIKKKNIFQISNKDNYNEIVKICDINSMNWNDNKELVFNQLGRTFKALIEIKYSNNINEYLDFKKYKLSKKLILFYLKPDDKIDNYLDDKEKKIIKIPNYIIGNILSFKTDFNYDKKSLDTILDNVPFRYFDFKKNKNDNYMIKFAFPLIEEIFKDIYKKIVLNNSYNSLKLILDNKGSGLATFFEMMVIQNLLEQPNSFDDFYITAHHIIQTIVPKKNEKVTSNIKLTLKENETYLIEQKIFGGKALDCLIIHMKLKVPIIFGLQISIYKEDIFDILELFDSYKAMIDNLNKIFSIQIKIENTFFGYIFDYSRLGSKEYNYILSNCIKRNLKYCFFNTDKKCFVNSSNKRIKSIYNFVSCPFLGMKNIEKLNCIKNNNNFKIKNYFKIESEMNQKEKNIIINFLSCQTKRNIINLKFLYKIDNENIIFEIDILFVSNHPEGIHFLYLYNDKKLMNLFLEKENYEIRKSNLFQDNYDVYKILFK